MCHCHCVSGSVKMRVTIFLLAGFAAVVAGENILSHAPGRVWGGSETTISEYPFGAVLLRYLIPGVLYSRRCGGTILNSRSILSAANCFIAPLNQTTATNLWRIRVGSTYAMSGGFEHDLAEIINHPGYFHDALNYDNDISIVRSATPFVFIPNVVQPASIAGPNYVAPDDAIVWGIGWGNYAGSTSSEQLRHVQMWVVNQEFCTVRLNHIGYEVTDNMVCAGDPILGGRDLCREDEGAPLLHNGVVIGVYSFGPCALAAIPGGYTRVSRYTDWILSNA